MGKGFDILALDKDYQIVSLLNYTLLQWTRKYFESGMFSVEIPTELYSTDFLYIYTKDRPELGKIEQVNYYVSEGSKTVTLSGYFLENELNRRIVFPYGAKTNITNMSKWSIYSDTAENVAFKFFNTFKDITYTYNGNTYTTDLGIVSGTSQGRGKTSEHTRGGEYLGNKIYTILKPSRMSYRIAYDFNTNEQKFSCWIGNDRTQDNTDGNNPIIFSTDYGNIIKADLLISSIYYKNGYVITKEDSQDSSKTYVIAGTEKASGDLDISMITKAGSSNVSDYDTEALYIDSLRTDGHEELLNNIRTVSLDFDTIESAYEYLTDFDLGDVCSIEIPEVAISVDAVLSGIYEVVKNGVWTMTLEFTQL